MKKRKPLTKKQILAQARGTAVLKRYVRYMMEYTHGNLTDPKNMRIEMEEAIGLKIEEPE